MKGTLTLFQWLSPAFPVSSYAYSHGLEQAVSSGQVGSASDLANWLEDVLRLGGGTSDAVLLAAAHRGEDTEALTDVARALAASRERWEETLAQGTAFAGAVTASCGQPVAAAPYPIALGAAARRLEVPTGQLVELYLQAFLSNLVSVAVRFVPLGQSEGQRVLAGLADAVAEVAARAALCDVDEIVAFVPGADLSAMLHETMDVRIFRT